jgi:exosortase E/protease (VPEID-CTERM system)
MALPYRLWTVLISLLLAEMLALTVSFDSGSLASGLGWWASLLEHSSELAKVAIAAVGATLVFGSAQLRAELARHLDLEDRPKRLWIALLAHLATFGLFVSVTAFVFDGGLKYSSYPGWWAVAWLVTGLLTLGCWVGAAIPLRLWWPLARAGTRVIAVGVAVGLWAWGLGRLVDRYWELLARWTFVLVQGLLCLVVRDPVCRPADLVVGTQDFQVYISAQCSGYEGIGLIWAFLAAYFWIERNSLRFPQAWLLVPIGTAMIWLLNAARIAALIAVGTWVSADVAAGGFHSQAGWLAFNAVGLGLVVASRRIQYFARTGPADEREASENLAGPFLVPLLSVVAVTMLTGAFTGGFDVFYPIRVLVAVAALLCWRGAYAGIWRAPTWHSFAVGAATFAVWMALEPASAVDGANAPLALGLARLPRVGALAWLAFRILGTVITVPIAEELAFRGYVTRRLIARDVTTVPPGRFTWASFLISSLLFGALHGRWLAGTLAGMAYCVALYRRGEIVDAIAAHATTNALIAALVLTTGGWPLWS